jgi:mannose-6-phosphate isomerase-like protein (cupin superfamily)
MAGRGEIGAQGMDFRKGGIGGGPRLHRHPYPETFIIRSGMGMFTVGGESIQGTAGQIVVVPAHTPHKFTNAGPYPLETIDIHESGRFITEWLE